MVNDSRGQVLLVGAVVLGITLIAIVTLLNGVAYTEHVGGGEQDSFDEAQRIEQSVTRDLSSMSASVADRSASASPADLQAATVQYESHVTDMTAASSTAAVSVTYDSATDEGTAIVHDDSTVAFKPKNGFTGSGSSWQPVRPAATERSPIESFDVSLTTSAIPQTPASPPASYESFGISIRDHGSSVTRTIHVSRTSPSSITVMVDGDGDGSIDTTCPFVASSTVDLDLVDGTVEGQSCSFSSLADESSDYSVTYLGAGPYPSTGYRYPKGTYKIVLSDPLPSLGTDPRFDGSGAPSAQTEVTAATYTYVYETPSMTYSSTIEIEVDDS